MGTCLQEGKKCHRHNIKIISYRQNLQTISIPQGSMQRNREKQQNGKDYRDFFKKIRGIKGTFHAKMGSIKDRNGMDLRKAEDIKKRWQEYTEELYKKRSSWPR